MIIWPLALKLAAVPDELYLTESCEFEDKLSSDSEDAMDVRYKDFRLACPFFEHSRILSTKSFLDLR